jgi:hypothetical protein
MKPEDWSLGDVEVDTKLFVVVRRKDNVRNVM